MKAGFSVIEFWLYEIASCLCSQMKRKRSNWFVGENSTLEIQVIVLVLECLDVIWDMYYNSYTVGKR
jgi:hypothetical protein